MRAGHADILSAGLDAGVAIAIIFIYFCLQYPANGSLGANTIQTWWGNNVYAETNDGGRVPAKFPDPNRGYFGPSPGTF